MAEHDGRAAEAVAALGIIVAPAAADLREVLGLPDRPGVLVSNVSGPAAAAGLKPGALIVAVADDSVATPDEFLEAVRRVPEAVGVRLHYVQGGEERTLELSPAVPREPGEPGHRL